jgi:hypothetical protein
MVRRSLLALLTLAMSTPAFAHPLHTTHAQVTYDRAARAFSVSLRVFADDFADAVSAATGERNHAGAVPTDSAMFRYVRDRFSIITRQGGAAPLAWCGYKRAGEVLILCLRTTGTWPIAGTKVRSALLTEKFSDQVNMVQASDGGRRRMLLFTGRDGAKALE